MNNNSVVPLSPDEVIEGQGDHIPDIVITAVNNLLKKEYNKIDATFSQDDIINEIRRLNPATTRRGIFENKWLDFEPIFERVGWDIEYDKPGYNEDYVAKFTFRKRLSHQRD
jgi:hypothetical protein